jgi:hypothetical protein
MLWDKRLFSSMHRLLSYIHDYMMPCLCKLGNLRVLGLVDADTSLPVCARRRSLCALSRRHLSPSPSLRQLAQR